jgi:hypothetical protein
MVGIVSSAPNAKKKPLSGKSGFSLNPPALFSSDTPTANKLQDQNDYGNNQQKVDEPTTSHCASKTDSQGIQND